MHQGEKSWPPNNGVPVEKGLECQGLKQMQVSQRAWASVENQQRGVHHLTLPGRGRGGAKWQALSLYPFPGRLRHSAVCNGPNETVQLLPPKSFPKTKQSTNTVASVCPECPPRGTEDRPKGEGAPHLGGHSESPLPITETTLARGTQ